MDPTISLVTLGVEDVARSVEFYHDGLDFPMRDREPDSDVAFFPLEGTRLSVYPRTKLAEDATVPAAGSGFSGVTLAHNVESPADVENVLSEATAAGGRLVKPADETFWGGYSGYFADPDDHLWEVAAPDLTDD